MQGQKLGNRSRLGERQGPWLTPSLTQSLTKLPTHYLCTENAAAKAVGCQFTFQQLHATSQDGLSLEFIAATAGRECNIQDARGGGLWLPCYIIKLSSHGYSFKIPHCYIEMHQTTTNPVLNPYFFENISVR